jgi:hypothetical protein
MEKEDAISLSLLLEDLEQSYNLLKQAMREKDEINFNKAKNSILNLEKSFLEVLR